MTESSRGNNIIYRNMMEIGEKLKKAQILQLLKKDRNQFVSGEAICRHIGVSRTAVWKHIRSLREEGYIIDAATHRGYSLTYIPDRLYPDEIADGLNTEFMGGRVYYHQSLESTNREARALASGGVPGGSLVVAEEQAGGRGRMGRGWFSPKGLGLWCSLILRPEVQPNEAPPITMLTAVAVASAVEKVTGVAPGIKWPNDLLVGGKKICGILTEMVAEMEKVDYLVVGVGINVNIPFEDFPEELRETATSLCLEKNELVSRLHLLKQFLREFEFYYQKWINEGFAPVLEEWKKRCINLGCPVRISTSREVWEGLAEDVDSDGALLLRMPGGSVQRFMAGEVSLRNS